MSGSFAPPGSGGGGSATWGGIAGTLSAQTDLNNALNARQPLDTDLTTIAAIVHSAGQFIRSNGTAWLPAALIESDIPSLTAGKVGSGVFDNGRVNWSSPSAIGSSTPNLGTFSGLTISGSGQISINSPARLEVARSTNQSITYASAFQFQSVLYNSVVSDPYSRYSTVTGQMTIGSGQGGIYLVNAAATMDLIGSAQRFLLSLFRNGVEARRLDDKDNPANSYPVLIGTTFVSVSAGDTLEIRVACGSAGTFPILGGVVTSFFVALKVG